MGVKWGAPRGSNPMSPARGCLYGFLAGLLFWAILIGLAYLAGLIATLFH